MFNYELTFPPARYMTKMPECTSKPLGSINRPYATNIDAARILSCTCSGITSTIISGIFIPNTIVSMGTIASCSGIGCCFANMCFQCIYTAHYLKAIEKFKEYGTEFEHRTIKWIIKNELHEDLLEQLGPGKMISLMERQGSWFLYYFERTYLEKRPSRYTIEEMIKFYLGHGANASYVFVQIIDNRIKGNVATRYSPNLEIYVNHLNIVKLPGHYRELYLSYILDHCCYDEFTRQKLPPLSDDQVERLIEKWPCLIDAASTDQKNFMSLQMKTNFMLSFSYEIFKQAYDPKAAQLNRKILDTLLGRETLTYSEVDKLNFLICRSVEINEHQLWIIIKYAPVNTDRSVGQGLLDYVISLPSLPRELLLFLLHKVEVRKEVLPYFYDWYFTELKGLIPEEQDPILNRGPLTEERTHLVKLFKQMRSLC